MGTLRNSWLGGCALALAATFAAGCATVGNTTGPQLRDERFVPVTSLATPGNAPLRQTRSGVTIEVMPVNPGTRNQQFIAGVSEVETWFTPKPGTRNYTVTMADVTWPERLSADVQIAIHNNSEHLLRMNDAAVTFSSNGTVINLNQSSYAALRDVVVPAGLQTDPLLIRGLWLRDDFPSGPVRMSIGSVSIGGQTADFSFEFQGKNEQRPIRQVDTRETRLLYPDEAQSLYAVMQQDLRTLAAEMNVLEADLRKYTGRTTNLKN